ncbi:MAG: glucan biosynthesis protein [Acidithiobacillus sp.]
MASVLPFSAWITLTLSFTIPVAVSAPLFSFARLQQTARKLAQSPWHRRTVRVNKQLRQLGPRAYGHILDKHPLWHRRSLPFEVLFYPLGHTFDHPVHFYIIKHGRSFRLRYNPKIFATSGRGSQIQPPQKGGYAGFSLLYPLDTPPYHNEFISFLGASYFRAVGKGAVYGTSARGLGIDTALPSGEIFPYFQKFWLQRPQPNARHMVIYALLNSPLITGAYRFIVKPGTSTRVQVYAVLFPRKKIQQLEIAPLSSMYWHGRGRGVRAGDWHPQQHDSSDLIMANGDGEWLTRPLNNPLYTEVSRFQLHNPKGFGLFQQDRHFSNYEGIVTQYQKRPSVWIQPENHWGHGQVELVELPTNNRNLDNIVTFWVPAQPPKPGSKLSVRYELRFFRSAKSLPPGGHPVATYLGHLAHSDGTRQIVVDFAGGGLGNLPPNTPVRAQFTLSSGAKLLNTAVYKNSINHQWQVVANVQPAKHHPSNVRLFLESHGQVLTDTWTYLLSRSKEPSYVQKP